MYDILENYVLSHPGAQPRDIIKFCYQSLLGPGHMAPERGRAAAFAAEELEKAGRRRAGEPEVELLEGRAARLDVDCRLSTRSLAALFCLSADRWPKGARTSDVEAMLRSPDIEAMLPFDREIFAQAVDEWRDAGRPAVSHSEQYKSRYRAHYRVIEKRFLPYLDAIAAVERLGAPAVVAIDGMCGSGKSTLADTLGYIFGAPVVHMDDFFLPFDMKTPERMAEPGGNVHYERFGEEILPHLGSGEGFGYGVFDCSCGRVTHQRRIEPSGLVIVEGSYCLNPHIDGRYDLKIFVSTDLVTQLERIKARDGEDALEMFRSRWIPLENLYFDSLGIREKCDIVVRT